MVTKQLITIVKCIYIKSKIIFMYKNIGPGQEFNPQPLVQKYRYQLRQQARDWS